jgi:pectate lyase
VAFGNKDAGQSAHIFNNTFRNCSQSGAFIGAGAATTNLVRNNIFTATRSISSVKNNAAAWTGESANCFYGFGSAFGHTLHATTIEVDPELDADYRPHSSTLKRAGTYRGGKDFYGKHFYDPPNIGGVDDVSATPRYLLTNR